MEQAKIACVALAIDDARTWLYLLHVRADLEALESSQVGAEVGGEHS